MASFPILNDFGVGAKCRSTQAAGINTSSGMKRACSGNTNRKGMGLDPIFIALPFTMSLSSGQDTGKPKGNPSQWQFQLRGCTEAHGDYRQSYAGGAWWQPV